MTAWLLVRDGLLDLANFQAINYKNGLQILRYRFLVSFNRAVTDIYYISMSFAFGGVGLICYYI